MVYKLFHTIHGSGIDALTPPVFVFSQFIQLKTTPYPMFYMFPSHKCEIGWLSSFSPGRRYSWPRTIPPSLPAACKLLVTGSPHSAPAAAVLISGRYDSLIAAGRVQTPSGLTIFIRPPLRPALVPAAYEPPHGRLSSFCPRRPVAGHPHLTPAMSVLVPRPAVHV